jgi:quercetin dioxygenase-like cupin family protein
MIMAKAGQVITHAVSGSQIKFIKTAEDTNGEYIEVEQIIKEGSGLPSHIHALQTETFRVISGVAKYRINKEERILQAGEEVSFSPGAFTCSGISCT